MIDLERYETDVFGKGLLVGFMIGMTLMATIATVIIMVVL